MGERSGSVFDDHDGLALAGLVAGGAISPSELLDEAIERVDALHDRLNVLTTRDYEWARKLIDDGLPDGPFRGVPFLRKDEGCRIEGLVTTSGTHLLAGSRSPVTSVLAERYLDAGLVIFGSTVVPPFSLTVDTDRNPQGPCRNPWDPTLTPGGSSAGAAAVVGAGALPMAHGNDGGGSLRIPSAWSGAFTVKPSRGRVPNGPVYTEAWLGFATEGTITRSVRDCAAMMDATKGPEVGGRYVAPEPVRPYLEETTMACRPLRVAVMDRTHAGEAFHQDHADATTRTADLLVELGHHVESAAPAVPIEALAQALYRTVAVDVANVIDLIGSELGREVADEELETLIAGFRQRGLTISGQEYAAANQLSMECADAIDRFMVGAGSEPARGYDVLLSPTMPDPPPPIGEIYRNEADIDAFSHDHDRLLNMTMVQNVTGQPAMSVPLWTSETGLPIGMMFSARYGDESTLFALAAQLEQAAPWWERRPPSDPG